MTNYEFLNKVKDLIGKTYSSCDCVGVLMQSLDIRFEGSNWLFRSIKNSSKYRYITKLVRVSEGETPPPGAVVFMADENKRPEGYSDKPDAYHCGVVDEDGYVIHSSPKTGVRKDKDRRWDSWDYWGLMKHVDYSVSSGGECWIGGDDHCSNLSDRELLEAIFNAVVRD